MKRFISVLFALSVFFYGCEDSTSAPDAASDVVVVDVPATVDGSVEVDAAVDAEVKDACHHSTVDSTVPSDVMTPGC